MGVATMLDAALDYIDRGWWVLPIHWVENGACSCNKACRQAGKHPISKLVPRGLHDATNDPDVATDWWTKWPKANVGIRTGRISNLWVLDIDARRSVDVGRGVLIPEGENTLRTLEDRAGERLPDTLTCRTGGGGIHYYFTFPQDGESYTNRVKVAPSIDVRGDGGYVIAPPSVHASGARYEWDDSTEPVSSPPTWLLTLQERNGGESFQEGVDIPEGCRNETLFKYASKLRGEDRDPQELATLVVGYNETYCKPPLDRAEVLRIIQNALKLPVNPPEAEFVWDEPDDIPEVEDGEDIFLSLRDLAIDPPKPKEPLVHEGIMDRGDGFILGGVSGAGKSWMAFDLGLAVATGSDWLSRFRTEQTTVLYIDEEAGISSSWERINMIARGRGIDLREDDVPFRIASMKGIKLDSQKGMAVIARALHRYRPGLVIFDALVRFHNGDENSTKDMAEFFDRAKSLKEAYDTAFVFLHHVRKPGKEDHWDNADMLRGSSDVRGWPDSAMVIAPNENRDGVYVAHVKSRNHRQLDNFEVGRVIDEGDGIARLAYRGDMVKEPTTVEERRAAIMHVIETVTNAPVTAPMIAGRTNMAESTVLEHLKALEQVGAVFKSQVRGQPTSYIKNPHFVQQGFIQ